MYYIKKVVEQFRYIYSRLTRYKRKYGSYVKFKCPLQPGSKNDVFRLQWFLALSMSIKMLLVGCKRASIIYTSRSTFFSIFPNHFRLKWSSSSAEFIKVYFFCHVFRQWLTRLPEINPFTHFQCKSSDHTILKSSLKSAQPV